MDIPKLSVSANEISALRSIKQQSHALTTLPHVHGLGVGLKRTNGQLTSTLCLRVYVTQKIVVDDLAPDDCVPNMVSGYPTDVIEFLPEHLACNLSGTPINVARGQSVEGGKSIGLRDENGVGTAGIRVFDVSTHREMILTNAHVLSGGTFVEGSVVIQPGGAGLSSMVNDGGTPDDTVAYAARGIEDNEIDAAVAHVSGHRFLEGSVLGVGQVTGSAEPRLGLPVTKSGRTSGTTMGVVTDIDASSRIRRADGTIVEMRRLLVIESDQDISCPGDSGSVLINNGIAVGLLFAGNNDGSIGTACRMDLVLSRLRVSITRGMTMQTIIGTTHSLLV